MILFSNSVLDDNKPRKTLNKLEMIDIKQANIEPKMVEYPRINEETLALMHNSSQYLEIEIPSTCHEEDLTVAVKFKDDLILLVGGKGKILHQRTKLVTSCTRFGPGSVIGIRSWLIQSPCKNKPMLYCCFTLNGHDLGPLVEINNNGIESISCTSDQEEGSDVVLKYENFKHEKGNKR